MASAITVAFYILRFTNLLPSNTQNGFTVFDAMTCASVCLKKDRCSSFFIDKQGNQGSMCYLSDKVLNVSVTDVIWKMGVLYYDIQKEQTKNSHHVKKGVKSKSCPGNKGYTLVSLSGPCVKLSSAADVESWEDGKDKCDDDGGRLVVLSSDAQTIIVAAYISQAARTSQWQGVWVGMKKTGTTFNWMGGSNHFVKRWIHGSPDADSDRKCVMMTPSGLSNNRCEDKNRYICEIPLRSSKSN